MNSYMGGQPWKAGKFCWSLRLSLWSEHLGLRPGQVSGWKMNHQLLGLGSSIFTVEELQVLSGMELKRFYMPRFLLL